MSHIDLPDDVVQLAQAQVAAGRAASVEDVIRAGVAALERDAERSQRKLETLRAAIDEGDASGVFEGDPFVSVRAELGLPPRRE
jgi:putative addiction module CopG family antidote